MSTLSQFRMISTSRLTWKLKCLQVQVGSLKLVPVPAHPPQTCCSRGMKSSRPLPKPRRCLFIPNCLMVLSNALFSHHPTFSSFLRDLPAVASMRMVIFSTRGYRDSMSYYRLSLATGSQGLRQEHHLQDLTLAERVQAEHANAYAVTVPTQPPKDWQMRDSWEEQDSAHGQTGKTD